MGWGGMWGSSESALSPLPPCPAVIYGLVLSLLFNLYFFVEGIVSPNHSIGGIFGKQPTAGAGGGGASDPPPPPATRPASFFYPVGSLIDMFEDAGFNVDHEIYGPAAAASDSGKGKALNEVVGLSLLQLWGEWRMNTCPFAPFSSAGSALPARMASS